MHEKVAAEQPYSSGGAVRKRPRHVSLRIFVNASQYVEGTRGLCRTLPAREEGGQQRMESMEELSALILVQQRH